MNIKKFVKQKVCKILFHLPLDKRKVVFISFDGGGYGCNPKYIAREMLKRNNLKLYWLYSPKKVHSFRDFPRRIKKIPMKTIYEYYHLCTAGCIIANNRTEIWNRFTKRPGQLYIQTWHGNMCFKKIEADVPNLSEHYVALAKQDAKNTDILLCGSRLRQKTCFEKSFFYDGSIAKFGLPRNDILLQTEDAVQKATVCEKLSIPTDVKILIYAPTFRDSGGLETYSIDYTALKYVLEQKFGGKWIILSRLHPNLCAVDNVLPNLDYVVDASKYPDMQELLMISDMMITDYSGCAFDFLLTKRPIFIFATDIQEYAKERDFYFPLQSTPFAIAETNQQLQQNIMNFNPVKYRKSADKFLKQCGMYETGKASEICVNMVEQFLKKGCLDENI